MSILNYLCYIYEKIFLIATKKNHKVEGTYSQLRNDFMICVNMPIWLKLPDKRWPPILHATKENLQIAHVALKNTNNMNENEISG